MRFILLGFNQHMGNRMFTFEGVADDFTREAYTVKADTTLTRKYGISVQELPLLCRKLLERGRPDEDRNESNRSLTFTEQDMLVHAKDLADMREAARQKTKRATTPPSADK